MPAATCPRCGEPLDVSSLNATLPTCARCQDGDDARLEYSSAFRARYDVQRFLGSGAMGTVVLATRLATGELVAVKFQNGREREDALARFRREGELLAGLAHSNVVRFIEVGDEDAHPYIVTEYLPGGTLTARMDGPMKPDAVLAIARPVLEGLAACHARGVVHRDLKPDNILFDADGNPRIADFGISRALDMSSALTRTGHMLGTPRYMAPEQVRGEPATPSSDIYAMGIVLYQMLAGEPPFSSPDPTEVLRAHLMTDPPPFPVPVPATLEAVVRMALRKQAGERPAHARQLLALLEASRKRPRARAPLGAFALGFVAIGLVAVAIRPAPRRVEATVARTSPAASIARDTTGGEVRDLLRRVERLKDELDRRVDALIDPDDPLKSKHPEEDRARRWMQMRAVVRDFRRLVPLVMEHPGDGTDEQDAWRCGELLVKPLFGSVDARAHADLLEAVQRWAVEHATSFVARALEAQRLHEAGDYALEKEHRLAALEICHARVMEIAGEPRIGMNVRVGNFYLMTRFTVACAAKVGDAALARRTLELEEALVAALHEPAQLERSRKSLRDDVRAVVEKR